jgi:hypothetical protein
MAEKIIDQFCGMLFLCHHPLFLAERLIEVRFGDMDTAKIDGECQAYLQVTYGTARPL